MRITLFPDLIRTKSADCCQFRMKNVVDGNHTQWNLYNETQKKYFKPIFCCFFFAFQLSCESPRGTGGSIRFCDCAARCKSEIRECLFWPWQRINTKSPSCLPIAIYWPSKSSAGRPWLGHKINACGAHRTDKSDMGAIDRRQAARIHRQCTHTFMPPRYCYCSVCMCTT